MEQKKEIFENATEKPSATKSAIAEYFSKRFKTAKPIGKTTIGDILRKQDVFYDQENNRPNETKRLRDPQQLHLERALLIWYGDVGANNIPITVMQ